MAHALLGSRGTSQQITEEKLKAHVSIAVSILRQFGNISLKALREHLQRRLGVSLVIHKPLIRRLGELSLEAVPNLSFATWEPLSPTLESFRRGRELFRSLSDVENEFHSGRWHDGPTGNTCCIQHSSGCWDLFCLEHGIQPNGQLPSDMAIDGFVASFRVADASAPVPRGLMVGDLFGCIQINTACWESSCLECGIRSDGRMPNGGDGCKGGSVSCLGCPLLERLLFDNGKYSRLSLRIGCCQPFWLGGEAITSEVVTTGTIVAAVAVECPFPGRLV